MSKYTCMHRSVHTPTMCWQQKPKKRQCYRLVQSKLAKTGSRGATPAHTPVDSAVLADGHSVDKGDHADTTPQLDGNGAAAGQHCACGHRHRLNCCPLPQLTDRFVMDAARGQAGGGMQQICRVSGWVLGI